MDFFALLLFTYFYTVYSLFIILLISILSFYNACFDQGQMTAEERNARPNEYGELTSKDYVPGAQVYASLYCDVKINFILDCSLQKCTSLANCLPRTCQWTFVYF
jgi:hypothetical protein